MEGNVRKYTYKPLFTLRNRRELINLIKDHQTKGIGGVLMEDVQDSMTKDDYDKIFKVKCFISSNSLIANLNHQILSYQ